MELKSCRVLVSSTSYGKNDPWLKTDLEKQVGEVIYNPYGTPLTSDQVRDLLPGIDGFIAGLDCIDRNALEKADRLKVIARYGVGLDGVDLVAAKEKGIIVTNTPGANSSSVAELTVALMLILARQLNLAFSATQAGKWPRLAGISLEEKTIALVGLGSIGKGVAKRLRGFDCRILAFDLYPDEIFAESNGIQLGELDYILGQADFVSLHLPLTLETKNLVNEHFIAKMKKGSYLINTARGEIIDEDSLFTALKNGYLAGAGLDALSKEPPDPETPLLALPNVVSTPHLGSQSDGAVRQMGAMALQDCLAVLQGLPAAHPVNI
jgi:D-3-phosphoglycerate dehydrogenase